MANFDVEVCPLWMMIASCHRRKLAFASPRIMPRCTTHDQRDIVRELATVHLLTSGALAGKPNREAIARVAGLATRTVGDILKRARNGEGSPQGRSGRPRLPPPDPVDVAARILALPRGVMAIGSLDPNTTAESTKFGEYRFICNAYKAIFPKFRTVSDTLQQRVPFSFAQWDPDAGGSSIGLLPAVLSMMYARDAVQSLQKLCLKTIGRQLKHYCNLRVQPKVAHALSESERRLIDAYDLSRLDVFEAQAFLQSIEKWLVKVEQNKWKRRYGRIMPNLHRTMKSFLRYALLPVTENQPEQPFHDLAIELGVEAPSKMQLREPISAVNPRRKWISGKDENPQEDCRGEDGTSSLARSPEDMKQDEVLCYRLSVGSVGCGIIASVLQHSSSLVKLRLNNCEITDAGGILLASGIRLTTVLQLLDLSNGESVYPEDESMRNEIGDNGVRAIALALEQNQSLKEVDLSGNPVGSEGAMALALMIRKNASLQRLYLDRSRVMECAETLVQAYQTSKSLDHLSMMWCGLHPGVGMKLASVQASKSALQKL